MSEPLSSQPGLFVECLRQEMIMAQRESKLSRQIIKDLKAHGGFWFKVWGNEHMMAGLPDIIGCYRGLFISFETKMPGKREDTSKRQDYVHGLIHKAGGVAQVITSSDEALARLEAIDERLQ